MRVLLTVIIMAVGGKAPGLPHEQVSGLAEVRNGPHVIATSELGNLAIKVGTGVYTITGSIIPKVPCQAQRLTITRVMVRKHRNPTVKLLCSIP
jgi:hypothetical protein